LAKRAAVAARPTAREREVLQIMAQGLDTRAIADQLAISQTTLRGYVRRILRELDAHSRLEAVVRASEYGLVD
jgi:DNA-binding NarL/FixJ family response regulator